MDLFHNLMYGFSIALSFQNALYCFVGCLLGTLIGVLPGIGPMATIAMLLPITFTLPPVAALIMLAGIYYGAQYGGSTTAILVNLPGETSSVVTCIDGYQMARQGRAGAALAIAAIGSFFAGTVCTMIIAGFGPVIAEIAFEFRAPEYFSLMLMGLVAAAVLSQGDMSKSLAMVALGLLFGVVGTDVSTGVERFSFGISELADGIGFVVIAVGVFAVGEIISNLGDLEERSVHTSRVAHLFPTKGGPEKIHRPDRQGDPARGVLRRSARHRAGHRLVLLLHGREESSPRTRRSSAAARSRAWRDPRPPTMRMRSASSSPCSRWGFPRAGRWP